MIDNLSITDIPAGAEALTCTGRSYKKAAEHLDTMIRRKAEVLEEYKKKNEALAGVLEELVRVHKTIDEIIKEVAHAQE